MSIHDENDIKCLLAATKIGNISWKITLLENVYRAIAGDKNIVIAEERNPFSSIEALNLCINDKHMGIKIHTVVKDDPGWADINELFTLTKEKAVHAN